MQFSQIRVCYFARWTLLIWTETTSYRWTPPIRPRFFGIFRYFQLMIITLRCALHSFTIGFFELPLFRTIFRFPWEFEIAGFNCIYYYKFKFATHNWRWLFKDRNMYKLNQMCRIFSKSYSLSPFIQILTLSSSFNYWLLGSFGAFSAQGQKASKVIL